MAALAAKAKLDLETPARYIEQAFPRGLSPHSQEFVSGGRKVRNIEAGAGHRRRRALRHRAGLARGRRQRLGRRGADRACGDETGSLRRVRERGAALLLRPEMGSWAWAKRARDAATIRAMFSLGNARLLPTRRAASVTRAARIFYPDRADFIAFVGDLGARGLVRRSIEAFAKMRSSLPKASPRRLSFRA